MDLRYTMLGNYLLNQNNFLYFKLRVLVEICVNIEQTSTNNRTIDIHISFLYYVGTQTSRLSGYPAQKYTQIGENKTVQYTYSSCIRIPCAGISGNSIYIYIYQSIKISLLWHIENWRRGGKRIYIKLERILKTNILAKQLLLQTLYKWRRPKVLFARFV